MSTTRLRITQKGRDVRRVAASLTAYAVIGCVGAASLYVLLLGMIAAEDLFLALAGAVTGR